MEPSVLYASPEPYPAIQVDAPNLAYAHLLTSALAASKSELTAVTQYTYFSWVTEPEWEPASKLFRGISKVEMRHLDMLGRTILALGGTPIFRSFPFQRPVFWNSGVLQYQSNIEKVLHISIASEQAAIDSYLHLSKLIQDQSVILILQRIVLDEKVHLQLFRDYLTTIETGCK